MPYPRKRVAAVLALSVMTSAGAACSARPTEGSGSGTDGQGDTSLGSAANGGSTSSSTAGSSTATTRVAGTGSGTRSGGGSTTGGSELLPADAAAALACAVRDKTDVIEVPSRSVGKGFRFSEYPARFVLDFSQADEAHVFEGDLWCHTLGTPCPDCPCPLNDCDSWLDPDEEIRIHMVTRGIDFVEFYGTNESLPGTPGAPLTPSVQYDASEQCPELPTVWTPDPAELTSFISTRIVCMHHSEDVAEVMFVRIP